MLVPEKRGMKLEAAQAFSTVLLRLKLDSCTPVSVLSFLAFVMEMKRRLAVLLGSLERVTMSRGRPIDSPDRTTASRDPLQLLVGLQLTASELAAVANVGTNVEIGALAQFMAAATEPPEEPASLVLALMIPRDLRMAETPTKYITRKPLPLKPTPKVFPLNAVRAGCGVAACDVMRSPIGTYTFARSACGCRRGVSTPRSIALQ